MLIPLMAALVIAGTAEAALYDPGGRRDPFVDLRKPVASASTTRCRCGGVSALLIQEVSLRGVVRSRQTDTALLQGPEGKTYFATVGARLYDGAIVAVEPAAVVFRQEVTDPLARARTRDVRIDLHPDSTDQAARQR